MEITRITKPSGKQRRHLGRTPPLPEARRGQGAKLDIWSEALPNPRRILRGDRRRESRPDLVRHLGERTPTLCARLDTRRSSPRASLEFASRTRDARR